MKNKREVLAEFCVVLRCEGEGDPRRCSYFEHLKGQVEEVPSCKWSNFGYELDNHMLCTRFDGFLESVKADIMRKWEELHSK